MATKNNVNLALSGIVGSGSFSGSTSSSFITPIIGSASATSISFSSTSGIIGTTTNDNAAAGSVGEFVSAVVSFSSALSLTNSTAKSIATISLTAGDWDVSGNIGFTGSSSTNVSYLIAWIGAGTGLPVASSYNILTYGSAGIVAFGQGTINFSPPRIRLSLASTFSINLNAQAKFTVSTCTAFGGIYARRVR